MTHIVNFSGGLCSLFAAQRTIAAQGAANTVLLFADVLDEDPDLYTFNARAAEILGVPITRISREPTPWQLFRREGLIGNSRFPICSVKLKRELLNQWMTAHFSLDADQPDALLSPATVVLGFDATEWHRVAEMQKAHPGWRLSARLARVRPASAWPAGFCLTARLVGLRMLSRS